MTGMSKKGLQTRQRILEAAEAMILSRGYAGTSVDHLIQSLGLTKGAFFHHFDSKHDLARHVVQRFSDDGIEVYENIKARAGKLSDDPLQQLLIIIGLYAEMFEDLDEPYAGCLLGAYVYEMQMFDQEVQPIIQAEFVLMRREISALIRSIQARYPARAKVDAVELADMFLSTFEGAFVMSKALNEADITAQQLRLYRTFIETLFNPPAGN